MRTYIADIIPRIQRFSQRLDDLTRLTNQHWVSLGDIQDRKKVFMFRDNNKLLIAENGIITDKGTWEYLGNKSLLLETSNSGYLLKHGFFDDNVLALKLDSKDEYAFLINENKYEGELNSLDRVIDFLKHKYIDPGIKDIVIETTGKPIKEEDKYILASFDTDKGKIEIELKSSLHVPISGKKAFMNGKPAPTNKYKFGFMWFVHIEYGVVTKVTFL